MLEPVNVPSPRTIDEFTQRIEALQQQHQQIASALCMARLARDMGLLLEHPTPRTSYVHNIRQWLAQRSNRVVPMTSRPEAESRVLIIDADTGEMTEEQENSDG